jgi:hypothetical protein
MALDSDISAADAQLHVEFFIAKDVEGWDGKPFVRIMAPGDKTNIIEQPVREDHKERFPRQWLYFQMKNNEIQVPVVGTSLDDWQRDSKGEVSRAQVEELRILKFQTVEQVAAASDSQLQRIGMGGPGLRERAKSYLNVKHRSESAEELEKTRSELETLKAQMAELMAARKPGRPPKVAEGG